MHLCFVDESGTPPKPTTTNPRPYFVIAGVIISEQQWLGISDELRALKIKYQVKGEIKWRFFGAHNNDPVNSVGHLNQSLRDQFRGEMFAILTSRKSVKIVACVASIAACYAKSYIKNQEDLYNYTYKCVSERFQYFLQDLSRVAGSTHHGLIVADHRGRKQDDDFRIHHHKLVEVTSPYTSNYANFVETIFLTPSHRSVGIQFADMVAGAIGRHFNSNDSLYFNSIRGSFRAKSDGTIEGYGLVKLPSTW